MRLLGYLAAALVFVTGCSTIIDPAPTSSSASKKKSKGSGAGADSDSDPSGDTGGGDAKAAGPGAKAATRLEFGTLASMPEHAADEMKAGITTAMVEIRWGLAEPQSGQIDDAYLTEMASEIATHRAAGRSITLALALHDTPTWVLDLPNGRMVDDEGALSDDGNFVFNQLVRDAADRFVDALAKKVAFASIDRLRVTSGGGGEVLYPGEGTYWAFDANAQNGPDLPATMPKNPLPGWKPGTAGPSRDAVRAWAEWYVGGLDDVVRWQMAGATRRGFKGQFEVLTPGMGVRNAEWEDAIANDLPHGLLGNGAAWRILYSKLGKRSDVVAYVSSVADGSGGDDGCAASDASIAVTDAKTEAWSATRYIARLAHEYGYGLSGENPGFVDAEPAHYGDLSSAGMLAASLQQARTCGLSKFYWAHDDRLWDGTIAFGAFAKALE